MTEYQLIIVTCLNIIICRYRYQHYSPLPHLFANSYSYFYISYIFWYQCLYSTSWFYFSIHSVIKLLSHQLYYHMV